MYCLFMVMLKINGDEENGKIVRAGCKKLNLPGMCLCIKCHQNQIETLELM